MVFAFIFCTLDNNGVGDTPGLPPLLIDKSVTGDKNWLAFNLVPTDAHFDRSWPTARHCTSALSHLL